MFQKYCFGIDTHGCKQQVHLYKSFSVILEYDIILCWHRETLKLDGVPKQL